MTANRVLPSQLVDIIQAVSIISFVLISSIAITTKMHFPYEIFYWVMAPVIVASLRNGIKKRKLLFAGSGNDDIALVLSLCSLMVTIYSVLVFLIPFLLAS